jgi:hypothetical protein
MWRPRVANLQSGLAANRGTFPGGLRCPGNTATEASPYQEEIAMTDRTMTDQTMAVSSNPLIAGARVAGTDVYNATGDHLGEIYDVMLDKQSGKVAYAIMSFGGFLGLGEKYHPIPWSVLDYDTSRGGYVVPLTKDKLKAAPMYDSEGEPDWDDKAYGKRVHDYYGTMPYWMM